MTQADVYAGKQTGKQADNQADRHRVRQIGRHIVKTQTIKVTDRQTGIQIDTGRQTGTHIVKDRQ